MQSCYYNSIAALQVRSIQKVWLLFQYARIQWLKLEPTGIGRTDDVVGLTGRLRGYGFKWLAMRGCFGQQLHLAATLKTDVPPGSRIDGLTRSDNAVVLQDGCLVLT